MNFNLYWSSNGCNYRLYDKLESRLFAIGLSYSIGGKDIKQARKRSIGIEDEKGRITSANN